MGHASEKLSRRGLAGARMLHRGNSARCGLATWLAAVVLAAGPITAQDDAAPGLMERLAEQQQNRADDRRPPSPAETMRVYRAIAGVVHEWKDDSTLTASSTGVEPPAFSGVCITLRLDGRVIGRGEALEPPADMPRVGLAPADWRWNLIGAALREAMDEARPHLPKTNDAFAEEARRLAAGRIMISLELAGEWTPITPGTWLEAEATLEPGLDGVAARKGGTVGHAVFPSTMLAANRLPHEALAGAAAEAIGEGGAAAVLDKPSVFTKAHNVALYRFRTTHLAQTAPGEPPVFLTRGQRVVELSSMSRASLADAADTLVDHLLSRIVEEGEGDTKRVRVIGVYEPWLGKAAESGTYARPDEMALMAYALVRYSRLESSYRTDRQHELMAAVYKLIKAISDEMPESKLKPEDPAVALIDLCTHEVQRILCIDTRSFGEHPELSRLFFCSLEPREGNVPLALRSLLLLEEIQQAIDNQSRSMRLNASLEELIPDLDTRLRAIYTDTPAAQLVMHMPWLGWAEQQLALAKKYVDHQEGLSWDEFVAEPLPDIPAAPALRQVRELVWQHQLSELDTGPMSADMAGGIVFTRVGGGGGTPLPTWQTARPIAFFGSMLVDERLTGKDERPLELARLLQAVRFLRQLQVGESQMWMFPREGRVGGGGVVETLGGVRASGWDQSMPLDASSFTLMAYTEAIRALDEMAE